MAREAAAVRLARAGQILRRLEAAYPDAHCALDHADPYQLLVATILSAQCTDVRVNLVTPAFFMRFPDARALAVGSQAEIEDLIRSTGFFRNKAKNLLAMAAALLERHGGQVPDTMDALQALPGVGRKTANVVLGNAFGRNEGVTVDTHVGRISRLLRLSAATDPEKVERDLMALFPQSKWTLLSHLFISHGRAVCIARRPRCGACPIATQCPSVNRGTRG
ncbi:MAG TPA: endonuclease III [Gemmatimonadales bacterium]|nr:endonuclease III [Gemmatimonadales bacterium]